MKWKEEADENMKKYHRGGWTLSVQQERRLVSNLVIHSLGLILLCQIRRLCRNLGLGRWDSCDGKLKM